jgi:hypothetical protein
MQKLGHLIENTWVEFSHSPEYSLPQAGDPSQRLVAGVPSGDPRIFLDLVLSTQGPYFLLYVLHTPRGEGKPGRYQSPELDAPQVIEFINRFRQFLGSDSRFDLWAYSIPSQSTFVWDRHNLLFAYGDLQAFSGILRNSGFNQGNPMIPSPHEHHYRPEFDLDAEAMLRFFDWSYSQLHPEDEQ